MTTNEGLRESYTDAADGIYTSADYPLREGDRERDVFWTRQGDAWIGDIVEVHGRQYRLVRVVSHRGGLSAWLADAEGREYVYDESGARLLTDEEIGEGWKR